MPHQTSDVFIHHIKRAFNGAWSELLTKHTPENIRHVNESVFRYFVIQHLISGRPPFDIEDEWKRIDLLLKLKTEQAAIEFKFYDSRPFNSIDGKRSFKGGAGRKNYAEFLASLETLASLHKTEWYRTQKANIRERYFILIGTNRPEGEKCNFMSWYHPPGTIKAPEITLNVIEQHDAEFGDAHIFGWLCNLSWQQ